MTVILQFTSLIFYRVQVREHLMRDQRHSFIQNHSRSFRFTDPWRCFFSSSHSSSTGFRSENTWWETRDHSFIQNHSRSFRFTAPWRCFFSSSHSCSTGFRSENTWWETRDIPSSRITPDPLDSQIHDGDSSVHLTHLLQGSGQRTPDERPETFLHPESLQILQIHRSMTVLLQFTSLMFYRVQVREHLMRDQRHSFIQNHSRSFRFTDPWRCFFSSSHSSSTGFRSEDTWWETRDIPSSRITPDPSDSQIHDGASSVHLTHVLQGSGQRTPDERPETFLHPESLQILQIHSSMTVLLQFISLMFYRVQVREHLMRDQRHSFIQNHSRSFRFTDPWRCFFSSSHSCSTGFRSENTWWETRDIPSSRITPDPLDSQIHDGASSVHLTHVLQGSGQRTPDERPETFLHPESLQILQIHRSMTVLLQFTSLIFYRVQVRGHLMRDQRHSFIQNHSRSFRFTDPWRCFFTSLIFYRVQVREHLMRDQRHSFIQNHSRSFRFTDPWRCFFSSSHSSSTGFRSEDTWWETRDIPSSRITPDPLDSQIHDGASSVHLTHVLQGSGQRTPDERSETFLHPESLQILQIHRSMTVLLQFISLIFYRVQVRGHLMRDQRHSFIQNHSRSFRFTDPWRCFFSSSHSCSTGFRSEDTWWEIRDIPSSRITPDPSDSQIHDSASSVHLTHVLQGSGQRTPDERPETFLHPESLQIL